jgi:hypothetical protein
MIAKFLNATTADGYNPYRVTRTGIDWEVPDPEDPWSNIGYWGDHQIIYLLRLLEASDRFEPEQRSASARRSGFTYAPTFRTGSCRTTDHPGPNPRDTIDFDEERKRREERVAEGSARRPLLRGSTPRRPRVAAWRSSSSLLAKLGEPRARTAGSG